MMWLEYHDLLQEVPLDTEVIVGTGAQATWRLRRADLMPKHFIVCASSEGAEIRPFSSDAVVSLNGRQLFSGATPLKDGDVISAGSGQFRFWTSTPSENRAVLTPPSAMMAHLVDGGRQPAVSLNRISTGIGFDDTKGLVVDDGASFDAEIRREAGGHALRATSSSPVRVNGKLLTTPLLLNEGDQIEIGGRVLRYTRETPPIDAPEIDVERVTETLEIPHPGSERSSYPEIALPATAALRNPMRAVAFVSSVIAAVAIATLVFLHRGP